MIAPTLNLALALLWLFLNPQTTLGTFLVGYGLGFSLLCLFRKVLPGDAYIRRTLAFGRFVIRFGAQFVLSNVTLAEAVLFRSLDELHPNFIRVDVGDMTRAEILMLTHCISLTPGTTTVEIAPDWKSLVIHAFDAGDPRTVCEAIHRGLKRPLLEFTR